MAQPNDVDSDLALWCRATLEPLVGQVPSDVIGEIISKSPEDLQEFLTMFGVDEKEAFQFSAQLMHRKHEADVVQKDKEAALRQVERERGGQFPTLDQVPPSSRKGSSLTPRGSPRGADAATQEAPKRFYVVDKKGVLADKNKDNLLREAEEEGRTGRKKKGAAANPPPAKWSGYVSENRKVCLCQGMKHGALTNCLCCGKINCKEEGYGPCLFCGNELNFDGIAAVAAACNDEAAVQLLEAVSKAKRLVEFDREAQKRTQVIDDATDWFSESVNPWLTQTQRKKAALENKHANRRKDQESRKMKITFDFFGRSVVAVEDDGSAFRNAEKSKFESFLEEVEEGGEGATAMARREKMLNALHDVHGSGSAPMLGASRELYENLRKGLAERNPTGSSSSSKKAGGGAGGGVDAALAEQQKIELETGKRGVNFRPRFEDTEFDEGTTRLFGREMEEEEQNNQVVLVNFKAAGPEEIRAVAVEEKSAAERAGPNAGGGHNAPSAGSAMAKNTTATIKHALFPAPKPLFTDGVDEGKCLSLHQPWASLIVHGFKRAEGRSWNVDGKNRDFGRGRLWIHAATKPADEDTVTQIEAYYRELYGLYPQMPVLPSQAGGYPTGCILGCVDLLSIQSQEEYRSFRRNSVFEMQGIDPDEPLSPEDEEELNLLPIEENNSEYIFWLESPRKLAVPCRASGDHKFWDIPRPTLKTLQKAVLPVQWPAQGLPQQFERNYTRRFDLREARVKGGGGGASNGMIDGAGAQLKTLEKKTPATGKFSAPGNCVKTVLAESFLHIHDLLTVTEQQRVVDHVRDLGLRKKHGFFVEQTVPNDTKFAKVAKLTAGEFVFDFRRARWDAGRAGPPPPPASPSSPASKAGAEEEGDEIDALVQKFYRRAIEEANRGIAKISERFVSKDNRDDCFTAQVLWAEFHHPSAAPQEVRQEEIVDDPNAPVVLLNIGASCKVSYALRPPAEGGRVLAVEVKSGDALVFGGASRDLYHGVQEIAGGRGGAAGGGAGAAGAQPGGGFGGLGTAPPDLVMAGGVGRLGVVLK